MFLHSYKMHLKYQLVKYVVMAVKPFLTKKSSLE